jgi:hypothetical protein
VVNVIERARERERERGPFPPSVQGVGSEDRVAGRREGGAGGPEASRVREGGVRTAI